MRNGVSNLLKGSQRISCRTHWVPRNALTRSCWLSGEPCELACKQNCASHPRCVIQLHPILSHHPTLYYILNTILYSFIPFLSQSPPRNRSPVATTGLREHRPLEDPEARHREPCVALEPGSDGWVRWIEPCVRPNAWRSHVDTGEPRRTMKSEKMRKSMEKIREHWEWHWKTTIIRSLSGGSGSY